MNALLRLPRWLAGAFLLFSLPAFADEAVALNCATIEQFRSEYSDNTLRRMAREHGYTAADIAAAEACFVPTPKPRPKGKTKKTRMAPPEVAPAPAPVPEVIAMPTPPASSWLWDALEYIVVIVIIGSALGLVLSFGREIIQAMKGTNH